MPIVIPSEGGCQCGEIRYRLIGEPIFLGGLSLHRLQAPIGIGVRNESENAKGGC